MKILHIYNCKVQWPLIVHCTQCMIDIEVSLPTDLRINRMQKMRLIEDCLVPTSSTEQVELICPICGNIIHISKSKIPNNIQKRIPISFSRLI